MRKFILLILALIFICFLSFSLCPVITTGISFADDGIASEMTYVYDEEGNFLLEKSGVEVGDQFLDKNFIEWYIFKIEDNIAFAKMQSIEEKPHVRIKNSTEKTDKNKTICLYMTHNDESYVPSDGYDSIYGAGGIHDIAKNLKTNLEEKGIKVYLDETLHLPHNSTAYSRSKVTATNLNNTYSPSGLFDIHRDGVARNVYLSQNETAPLSKIRIVVGKGNPNFEQNYSFAKEIFSVGQALYPWLFLDVYCGKGTYNQNLQEHALLFEMGTYLIEKDYVLSSVPYLANVVDTVLFNSQTDKNGDLVISEDVIDELEEDYENRNNFDENNENLPKNDEKTAKNNKNSWIFVIFAIGGGLALCGGAIFYRKKNRLKIK